MLGDSIMYAKTQNGQRRRIDLDNSLPDGSMDKIIIKNVKLGQLKHKYFQKIINEVIKAIHKNKNNINFYYNYYDFTNERIGKPHGLLNEFMYEMCYEYSVHCSKDCHGKILTFKTLDII